mmetsp:Transcript_16873/g.31025  ORF Transcript_16873/g.31025 Transcript_16873/m.31025 type:complete len:242 (-) Transcript_16873:1550-2275(-)
MANKTLIGELFISIKYTNVAANCFSSELVVSGDHDYADSSTAASNHGVVDFCTGRVLHSNNTNPRQVLLYLYKFGGVLQLVSGGMMGAIIVSKRAKLVIVSKAEAAKSLLCSTVELIFDRFAALRCERNYTLGGQHRGASIEKALRGSLDKKFVRAAASLSGGDNDRHRLAVASKFKSSDLGCIDLVLRVLSELAVSVAVDLLNKNSKSSFGGRTDMLELALFVALNRGLVTDSTDLGDFL